MESRFASGAMAPRGVAMAAVDVAANAMAAMVASLQQRAVFAALVASLAVDIDGT